MENLENGKKVADGSIRDLDVLAQKQLKVKLPFQINAFDANAELILEVGILLKKRNTYRKKSMNWHGSSL